MSTDIEKIDLKNARLINDGKELKQADIENKVAKSLNINKQEVSLVFNEFWDTICQELKNGNKVKLHGKGVFYLSERSGRMGRNPITKKEYPVSKREAMAFKTSPAFAKRLKNYRQGVNDALKK